MIEDIHELLSQVQAAQGKMHEVQCKIQERLETIYVTAESGAGAVKAVANGNGYMRSIEIAPEFITPQDPETLQDLIVAAVNLAVKQAKEQEQEEKQRYAKHAASELPFDFLNMQQ